MALAKPVGTGKREEISLDAAAGHVLEQCRMVLPGIQALFGFQLIAVFNQGFGEKLSHTEQLVHLVALVLTTLSMALVMTPAALHRMAEPKAVSERFLWLASNMILAGMFPLGLAVGLDRRAHRRRAGGRDQRSLAVPAAARDAQVRLGRAA